MDLRAGDRGVSEVVGFILVFGMVVVAFTVYQGVVVPDQNRQVEFQHNLEVQGQLQDLRNAIVTTAATGSGQAVSVTLGATYPSRALAQNLGVSGGSLQTTEVGPGVRIANARATDDETADYLDGSQRTFETKSIRYTPVYSFYSNAPQTVYENSLLYNQFDVANLTITDQVIVDDRRITVIVVNGSLAEAEQDTVSISTEAVSASSTRVSLTNTSGDRVNVTIPTRLDATTWAEVLVDQTGSDGYVEAVSDVSGERAVNITLRGGVTYELRMAKVGIGDATTDEDAEYVVDVVGDDTSVAEGGTQKLVAEVRDRFNNPVSNVTVSASDPSLGSVSPSTATTDADGRAVFVYEAPDDVSGAQDVDVDVTFDGGGTPQQSVTFDVRVIDSDGSGGGTGTDEINPADSGDVRLEEETASNEVATLTLNNTASSPVDITSARLNFYLETNNQDAELAEIGRGGTVSANLTVGGPFVDLDPQIQLDPGTSDVTVTFYRDANKTQTKNIKSGEFFVLTLVYSNGETDTYFVAP